MNFDWRLTYPSVFGSDDWYGDVGLISPLWGRVDEASRSLLSDAWPKAATQVYFQVYEFSGQQSAETEAVLERSRVDALAAGKKSN